MADKPKIIRVRFEPPVAVPPRALVVGDTTFEPGSEYDLPADIAEALLSNPEMHVIHASDAPAEPVVEQTTPNSGAETKED